MIFEHKNILEAPLDWIFNIPNAHILSTFTEPKLRAKGLEYYLIKNERIPELAIYSFDSGERFEPDFLLFIREKEYEDVKTYQAYVEPKGSQLLFEDEWKEKFLGQIKNNYKINDILGRGYKIIGLPFFNQENRMSEFDKALNDLVSKL